MTKIREISFENFIRKFSEFITFGENYVLNDTYITGSLGMTDVEFDSPFKAGIERKSMRAHSVPFREKGEPFTQADLPFTVTVKGFKDWEGSSRKVFDGTFQVVK